MTQNSISFAQAIIIALVSAVIVGLVIVTFLPRQVQVLSASPAGTGFSTAKLAATNYAPATSAASSTSILNTDANTRYISDAFVSCFGANGQGGTFTFATTTVANLGTQGNSNSAAAVVASTTAASTLMYTASSTEGVLPYTSRLWPSGTYLTITDSTTNQGTCTVGVHYLQS